MNDRLPHPRRARPPRARARRYGAWSVLAVLTLVLAACTPAAPPEVPPLREAAQDRLEIGTAVEGITESDALEDPAYVEVLGKEFSSVTPENQMKWGVIHPQPDVWNFAPADQIVDFASSHGQQVRGHTLLWHGANPAWVEDSGMSCEEMRTTVEEHVSTLVSRYRGRVTQWDVANELFEADGSVRTTNPFVQACGLDIIKDAFRWAHAADPQARLFINDYSAEGINDRSNAYYEFAQELLAEGVPLHGYGVQSHLRITDGVPSSMPQNFARFADLGLEIAVTEADVRMDWHEGDNVSDRRLGSQAEVYGELLDVCLGQPACRSFTVWGFTDRYSWLPEGVEGEGYAAIMTKDYDRKPAFDELAQRLEKHG